MKILSWYHGKNLSFPAKTARRLGQLSFRLFSLGVMLGITAIPTFGSPLTNLVETGIESDLAITGPGYFILRDADSSLFYVTRFGAFTLDEVGYLISASSGMRVQGFCDVTLTNLGDVKIDNLCPTGSSSAAMQSFVIDPDGEIEVSLSDGTAFVRGQILLQNFDHPENLQTSGCDI